MQAELRSSFLIFLIFAPSYTPFFASSVPNPRTHPANTTCIPSLSRSACRRPSQFFVLVELEAKPRLQCHAGIQRTRYGRGGAAGHP